MEELECLILVVARTDFSALPDEWSPRGEGRSLPPGLGSRVGAYLF